jgi:hypothetical protein
MCGRIRLSSDVSEIKIVFSIPPHRPTPAERQRYLLSREYGYSSLRQIAELLTANMSEKREGLKRCWRPIA